MAACAGVSVCAMNNDIQKPGYGPDYDRIHLFWVGHKGVSNCGWILFSLLIQL